MIVGAGYIGLEMAEALHARGLAVTVVEQLPEVLPTVDPELGALVRAELERHDVRVLTAYDGQLDRTSRLAPHRLGTDPSWRSRRTIVLVVVGVRPDTRLGEAAGIETGARGASRVNRRMETNVAARLRGRRLRRHLPPPARDRQPTCRSERPRTSRDGSRARTPSAAAAASKARSAPRSSRSSSSPSRAPASATTKRPPPGSTRSRSRPHAYDHKIYYPGRPATSRSASPAIAPRRPAARRPARRPPRHEVPKRIDIAAAALHHGMTVDELNDLDLSYTPPFGSPWDPIQTAAQEWTRARSPAAVHAVDAA